MVATLIEPRNKVANNVGTRIFMGRLGTFNNTTPKTFQFTLDTEEVVDAVRVLFVNGAGSTLTITSARVVKKADWTAPNISSGTLSNVLFSGAASGTVPAATGSPARGFLWSDWVELPDVPRTDGQRGSVVTVAAYIAAAATITILGNGSSDNYAPWAVQSSRKVMMRYNDGDCITTPANFTSTTNRIQSPIVGIQYIARGMVRNVFAIGDSITEGRGTLKGGSFVFDACKALSDTVGGPSVEYSCLAVPSINSTQYHSLLDPALTLFGDYLPDVGVFPTYTPNDATSTPSAASVNTAAVRALRMAGRCAGRGIHPVLYTGIPTNRSVYVFDALDAFRRDKNAEALADWYGLDVVDTDTAVAGPVDGGGQAEFISGYTTDGIHPNDTGNAAMAAVLEPKLREILGIY